jgi:hypothetical protein
VGIAELDAPASGCGQSRSGARRDGLRFCLSDHRENTNSEAVRPFKVAGYEVDAAVPKRQKKRRAPSESIELCD